MNGPLRYPVEILNDDVTPFSVVAQVINEIFGYSRKDAADLTNQVHEEGSVVLGSYIYEIAETKIAEVQLINKLNDLNIQVQMDTSADKEDEDDDYTDEVLLALLEQLRKDKGDDQ